MHDFACDMLGMNPGAYWTDPDGEVIIRRA